ncbi:MAG: tRNA uridine-5-carboxymethylaminomethyl(34) synthesis enzyme MnmG [Pseudomonadota bacterium]|nr:tRNA uridine-5-carboxymethylaminomethyl(34) synthesis enzyme MnmG [Pseudomonadota bacterium]
MKHPDEFEVIVVGGGHAGAEAAQASAKMGAKTLLLTQNIDSLGAMSCNPSIGGIGKGHLVREIDALGGIMGEAADSCGIHCRTLNASKGPAVRATRLQIDRTLYRRWIRRKLENTKNLNLFQQSVEDLHLEKGNVIGVRTQAGIIFLGKIVVLTVGTFLNGLVHIGQSSFTAGRAGEPASVDLSRNMADLAFNLGRLKTGTPPRLSKDSLNFELMDRQPGDSARPSFSFFSEGIEDVPQVNCYLTQTNLETHEIIREALDRSPIFNGTIDSNGPRYCPSIEDKVSRFGDRNGHQIFVEPEGLDLKEIYPNGISTSLPFDVQLKFVRSIKGFENAFITRPGYAIEYDYFDPTQLRPWMESKKINNLFFAGQINGTTGYEEAAAQGILAGINAALRVDGKEPWYPSRSQAYLGVLVDDLVTRGTDEPYRMFTSRAEYRLSLREDNADQRLLPQARGFGLIDDLKWARFEKKVNLIKSEEARLEKTWLSPDKKNRSSEEKSLPFRLRKEQSLAQLLRRPEISYEHLVPFLEGPGVQDAAVIQQIEYNAHYFGYVERQKEVVAKSESVEKMLIPEEFDYEAVKGLSNEIVQKLTDFKPATLGQASRISGVTPVAISLVTVFLKKHEDKIRSNG